MGVYKKRQPLIRNFDLLNKFLYHEEELKLKYGFRNNNWATLIRFLCEKHNSFTPYIDVTPEDRKELLKILKFNNKRYLSKLLKRLNKLELILIIDTPKSKHNNTKLRFTSKFVEDIASKKFTSRYNKWLSREINLYHISNPRRSKGDFDEDESGDYFSN